MAMNIVLSIVFP